MQYDSDYDVRLATLGALGGDTTRYFDSLYSVDIAILEAIEQGGGGGGEGLTWAQIKGLLSASGVTEIKFNDDSSSITLDYAEIAKIDTAVQMYDGSVKKIRVMSQSDYDLLETKDNNIIYYTYTE